MRDTVVVMDLALQRIEFYNCDRSKLENFLQSVEPAPLSEKPIVLEHLDDASIVWICEKMEPIMQRVCIQVKNIPDLRRLIIYTLDAESVARVLKQPAYDFVFEHPALKVCVLDPESYLDFEFAKKIYNPQAEDLEKKTSILANFPKDSLYKDYWVNQTMGIHEVLTFMSSAGSGNHDITHDTYIGFKNTIKNLPEILKHPDVRNLKGLFTGKPCFVLGAGPSIEPQLQWLKKYQDQALLVAADTMLEPLREVGIRPHIITSIERTPEVTQLLDGDHPHPETLLLASGVLDPECFKTYQGPRSIYLSYAHFNYWLPFPKSQFGTGHSCVGLAMGVSAYLQCDPIFLMGIDLCWSRDGSSHMSQVPYLSEEFYKEANQLQKDRSFVTKNSEGQLVETNEYWTMFRYQFDNWTNDVPAKVYNLSPTGLPLSGAEKISLEEVDSRKLIQNSNENFFSKIKEKLPYQITQDQIGRLKELQKRSDFSVQINQNVLEAVKRAPAKEIRNILKSAKLWEVIYYPVFQPTLPDLESKLPEQQELAKKVIIQHLELFDEVFKEANSQSSRLLNEQKKEGFALY